ncbi:MAG: bifunctional metallophosphatase/5'-nucleotidase [Pseudomonadota bacterium]
MSKLAKLLAGAALVSSAIGLLSCGGGGSSPSPAPPTGNVAGETVTVSLIGLNDFHGNLLPIPNNGVSVADPAHAGGTRVSAGGIAYLATLVTRLKAQNPGNTLVVAAGDMIGASPSVSALFHDEPTVDALNSLGLDISSVGNHEFDKGRAELLRIQYGGCYPKSADTSAGIVGVDTCMSDGKFSGAKFSYLAANVIEQSTGKTLFAPYEIRRVAGVDIAFIGVTLKDTPSIVTPSGVAGLSFTDEADTVNKLVPELKAKGAAAIVVLIHQGGSTTAATINDKSCPNLSGEIVALSDRFDPAIDVVISGHTHQEYVCARPDGKLLTQAGLYGLMATKIDLKIDARTGRVLAKSADNIAAINPLGVKDANGAVIALPAGLSALPADATMAALVQRYVDLSAPVTNVVIGKVSGPLSNVPNRAGESKMGDVVGDMYLAATSGPSYAGRAAQIAFANPGGIRAGLTDGTDVTIGQLFAVMPFANTLTTLDLTGAQLLRLLEQQWEAPQPAGGHVMQVSEGFTYTWDGAQAGGAAPGSGARVIAGSMKLNGVAIDMGEVYRITVNNFMANGGDNFTLLLAGKNIQQGELDMDAGVAYFRALGTVTVPAQARITRIN